MLNSKKIMAQESEVKKLYRNVPQMLAKLIMANIIVLIWGRRTGKTEGFGADWMHDKISRMPRSNGLIQATTYEQILTRTLPPLISGLESLGYKQNQHFWVKRFPDKKLKIPQSYKNYPLDPQHYIQFWNGCGWFLVSQDRPGTSNGVASQYIYCDEAKFINFKKYKEEAAMTLSGCAEYFGHLSCYRAKLFMTDMPTDSKGNWLFDFEKLMNKDDIKAILYLQIEISKLKEKLDNVSLSSRATYMYRISQYNKEIEQLRKGLVYYSVASTLDNIDVLGLDTILGFIDELDKYELMSSVFSKRIRQTPNNFYINLNEEKHGYYASNYSHIENLNLTFKNDIKDCRWDSDIELNSPLRISCDYNNKINSIVTGQQQVKGNKFLSSIYVLSPQLLKDCVHAWHNYYQYHPTKDVYYYFDNTAIAKRADQNESFADQWIKYLKELGWNVIPVYIGQSPSHDYRFYLWQTVCGSGNTSEFLPFSFNRDRCDKWFLSCANAEAKRADKQIKKVKASENDLNVHPSEATHLSEAGDILFYVWYKHILNESSSVFVDMM